MDQFVNPGREAEIKDSHTYKSACRMCHGGCGVLVHVKDGDIQKIEGDPDNPMNKGKLCPLGAARLGLELTKGSISGALHWYADINFLHFAILLFGICTAVMVVISLLTPPHSDEKLAGLTFATASAGAGGSAESNPIWRRNDLLLSILLIAAVALVWISFRG